MALRSLVAPKFSRRTAAAALASSLVASLGAACGAEPAPVTPAPRPASSSVPADPHQMAVLDEGEREIAAAAGDCAQACEGLARVVHARIALCSPSSNACANAEKREADARSNVASFCDPCGNVP
jgi:hypothetical protein